MGKDWQKFFFEIPALLSCERGNQEQSRAGKFKLTHKILNFPTLDVLICKIKEWQFLKKNSVVLYPVFLYTLHRPSCIIILFTRWVLPIDGVSTIYRVPKYILYSLELKRIRMPRLSKCVVSCKWHDTTRHQKTQKIWKKII